MNKRIPIILGIFLTLVAVWALVTTIPFVRIAFERIEHIGYDLQLRARLMTEGRSEISPIAIIDIDNKSLQAEGRWPWSRSKVAALVNELEREGAAVIAFDIFFPEKENNIAESLLAKLQTATTLDPAVASILKQNAPLFDEDAAFANALVKTHSVLAIGFLPQSQTQNLLPQPLLTLTPDESRQLDIFQASGYISNLPILQEAAKYGGFINIFPDSDGIIRHAPLLMAYQNKVYASLALQAVLTFLDEKITLLTPRYGDSIELEGVKVGNVGIPTDAKAQVLIPFIGPSYTFPYFSATDVLNHKLPKDALLGKILLIGTSATGMGDLKATAIQNPYPGVEVQASLINGILQNNFSYIPAWTHGANVVLTLVFGLIAAFAFPYMGPRSLGIVFVTLPPTMIIINNLIWTQTGLILSFLVPVMLVLVSGILNIIYGYLFESRRRERLKEMFGQYVPSKHIDEMLRETSNYALHGEDREMSVLFADIRSFTTISEGLSAKELVELLNTFFTPMTEIIFNHRGTIDKYVGDLIMAFWGAPLKDKHHARHAIESAIEMQRKLTQLRAEFEARNWPEVKIGIGINSGIMSVGDMGSRYRRNYTVLGDAVNLASRVEGLTKYYGVDVMVTESTQKDNPKFVFRQLDKVRVKGKKLGVSIYEVVCYHSELTPALQTELDEYHQGLNLYFQQQWDRALEIMQALHQSHPDTKIYKLYIERITHFKQNPVAADWDGVYAHVTK